MEKLICLLIFSLANGIVYGQDVVLSCGGFIQSSLPINFAAIKVKLYTSAGHMKYETECAPNNGYYMIPVYSKGLYKLKVEPPAGWEFENDQVDVTIDGVTDPCTLGQDINFKFNGFSVVGKVCVDTKCDRPIKNVQVGLFNNVASTEPNQKCETNEAGEYVFRGVAAGKYVVKHMEKSICVPDNQLVTVTVSEASFSVSSHLIVKGFSVQGDVKDQNQPLAGSVAHLFGSKREIQSCAKSKLYKDVTVTNMNHLCSSQTDSSGTFSFTCLEPGQYTAIVLYESGGVKFDVLPEKVVFEVVNSSLKLKEVFKIHGFSLSGRILWSENGKPVQGAKISVNNLPLPHLTDSQGYYFLTKIFPGHYEIGAQLDNVEFTKLSIDLSIKTHNIPNFYPSKLNLCGRVHVNDAEDSRLIARRRSLLLTDLKNPKDVISFPADKDGYFCRMANPGTFNLEPQLLPDEKNAGISLQPHQLQINLIDGPFLNAFFEQFKAKVSGSVKCLSKCGEIRLVLSLDSNPNTVVSDLVLKSDDSLAKFTFNNLINSRYSINPTADKFCWKKSRIGFKIDEADVSDVLIEQSGFAATVHSSHEAKLTYKSVINEDLTGVLKIHKGKNKFCLPESGRYTFNIESCHLFAGNYGQEVFNETHNNTILFSSDEHDLTITAKFFKVEGIISSVEPLDNVHVSLRYKESQDKPTSSLALSDPVRNGKFYEYRFELYAEKDDELEFVPMSSVFLFEPESSSVQVKGYCINDVKFQATRGYFLHGQISPALEDVQITLSRIQDDEIVLTTYSNATGQYSIGPLKSLEEFTVTAEKTGYIFSPLDKLGHFHAYKLSELILKTNDADGNALSGVLLSLSGKNYRSNNLTGENGSVIFVGLTPGEYFIKPVFKEYSFEPVTKLVKVEEGSTVTVELTGKRVAYSCTGILRHLAGQPVAHVDVEAVPGESCASAVAHEEAMTGDDGSFRIRGLMPGCVYTLQVKPGQDGNPKRTVPAKYSIQVIDSDVVGKDLVVKPEFTTMEIAGRVECDRSLLSFLKVVLYKESAPETPVHTVALHSAAVFFFPVLPIDHTNYVIRLEHSLPGSKYVSSEYPETTVKANTSFHYLNFKFMPKRKQVEPENLRGGYIAIPLTFLVVVLAYNYEKLFAIFRDFSSCLPLKQRPSSGFSSSLTRKLSHVYLGAPTNGGNSSTSDSVDGTNPGPDDLGAAAFAASFTRRARQRKT